MFLETERQHDHPTVNVTSEEKSVDSARQPSGKTPAGPTAHIDFPEGGLRAWIVAACGSGILFCAFGYLNSFG
jgi:hypothetical protein